MSTLPRDADVCPAHGSWFDTGELANVMRAYARSRKVGALTPGPRPPLTAEGVVLRSAAEEAKAAAEPGLLEVLHDIAGSAR